MTGMVTYKMVISKIISVRNEPYKLCLLLSRAVTNVGTNELNGSRLARPFVPRFPITTHLHGAEPSWEADGRSATQEFPNTVCNPKVH
jgi:hypothetical protein